MFSRNLVLVAFICLVTPAAAQLANPDSALQNILDGVEGQRISLQEAMQHALTNATSVKTAEAAYASARGAARHESGAFDPELFFALNYVERRELVASIFANPPISATTQTIGSAGLRYLTPIGTRLELSMNTVRLGTNSLFAFLNPQYNAVGNLSFRQPLLGGFFVSARKEVVRTDRELDAARARYDQAVIAVQSEVEQRYWDLYATERNYAVQRLTRDQAQAFLRETELRAKAGLVGPNQVASARTFLAEQEILLIDREEDLDRLSDQFASLIGMRPAQRYLATDSPPETFTLGDLNSMIDDAKQRNLDLQAAQFDVEARRALSNASLWEALPKVDLVGAIGGTALTGTAQDVNFAGQTYHLPISGDLNEAIRQAYNRKYPTWNIGVEVSVPIGFRSGFGERERLRAQEVIAEQRYILQARALEEQVRASYRELFHGSRRLNATREEVAAAQEQVRIGLIEFQNGRTTAFELVRLGADFAGAQQRYSQALVRSAKAAAALRQLTSGVYK
jgi:outer membrane protein TolC